MSSPISQEHSGHIARQLGFLRRSCELYDRGDTDEAVRIATTIRVLLHDTAMSTSLLMLADKKDIHLLTSISEVSMAAAQHFNANAPRPRGFNALVIPKRGKNGEFALSASLGTKEHLTIIKAQQWWDQVVFFSPNVGTLSRKELVLAAANKDGGAHVDLQVPEKYASVRSSRKSYFRPAAAGETLTPGAPSMQDYELALFSAEDEHFATLRQMGYELLLSEELLALCGLALGEDEKPVIWPS